MAYSVGREEMPFLSPHAASRGWQGSRSPGDRLISGTYWNLPTSSRVTALSMPCRQYLASMFKRIAMQHLTAQAKQRRWQGIFVSGILIVVASVGLAACNYPVSAQNSSAAQAQVNQTGTPEPPIRPTPSPTRGTGAAPAACGVVNGYGSLKVVPKDQGAAQAENCFWQAFQRCQAATLVFLTSGVGKG